MPNSFYVYMVKTALLTRAGKILGQNVREVLSFRNVFVLYRVSIKSFPDYKYLLKENYVEYKHIFLNVTQLKKFF